MIIFCHLLSPVLWHGNLKFQWCLFLTFYNLKSCTVNWYLDNLLRLFCGLFCKIYYCIIIAWFILIYPLMYFFLTVSRFMHSINMSATLIVFLHLFLGILNASVPCCFWNTIKPELKSSLHRKNFFVEYNISLVSFRLTIFFNTLTQ